MKITIEDFKRINVDIEVEEIYYLLDRDDFYYYKITIKNNQFVVLKIRAFDDDFLNFKISCEDTHICPSILKDFLRTFEPCESVKRVLESEFNEELQKVFIAISKINTSKNI